MAVPEGYKALAKVGIAYKGDYKEGEEYSRLDAVYYNGSTYVALVDNPSTVPTADGTNWQYMAKGFMAEVVSRLEDLTATDTNGIIDEAGKTVNSQLLVDGIGKKLGDKLSSDGDISETVATFEEAETRENIESGEKTGTIRGKIKKWLTDLTAAAFAQVISSYPDLMANTMSGYLVDALAVKEGFTELNSNMISSNYKCVYFKAYNVANNTNGVFELDIDLSNYDIPKLASYTLLDWADARNYIDTENTSIGTGKVLYSRYNVNTNKIAGHVYFPTKASYLSYYFILCGNP